MAGLIGRGGAEGLKQHPELSFPADHRRVEMALDAQRVRVDLEEAMGLDRLRFSPELQRLRSVDADGIPHQPVRQIAQQDLPRGRGLLQSGRNVDRVPGHQVLAGPGVTRHDLAGVHPDPGGQGDTPGPVQLVVELRQRLPHLRGGPDRS